MGHVIGLDIGGTKIAGGVFTSDGKLLHQVVKPSPKEYARFITKVRDVVVELERHAGVPCEVGISMVGAIDYEKKTVCSGNLICIVGKPVFSDIDEAIGKKTRYGNDANCSALAEAIDGAGTGAPVVLGLIMGTGIGSGLIVNRLIVEGPNGTTGEIGHTPLPNYEEADGPKRLCPCGRYGCIEAAMQGSALADLYEYMCGQKMEPPEIADKARAGDKNALRVLDRYYEIVAKAMIVPIHMIDPDIIVVSGGLNSLPGLYEEVPKRWGKYCLVPKPKTLFVPAAHGPMAGMRGAAFLWRD